MPEENENYGRTPKGYKVYQISRSGLWIVLIVLILFVIKMNCSLFSNEAPLGLYSSHPEGATFEGQGKAIQITQTGTGEALPPLDRTRPTPEDVLDAIEWVESRGDANAVGDEIFVKFLFDGRKLYEYQSIGAYQLTEIYVDDCNRIMQLYIDEWQPWVDEGVILGETRKAVPVQIDGKDFYQFTYEDRWDKLKSRMITRIVTRYYTEHDGKSLHTWEGFETAARTHKNPNKRNHPSTEVYWELIKARLVK